MFLLTARPSCQRRKGSRNSSQSTVVYSSQRRTLSLLPNFNNQLLSPIRRTPTLESGMRPPLERFRFRRRRPLTSFRHLSSTPNSPPITNLPHLLLVPRPRPLYPSRLFTRTQEMFERRSRFETLSKSVQISESY